jgi:tetratricopeptide (TPR) repeat protein
MRRGVLIGLLAALVVGSIGALRPASERLASWAPDWFDPGHDRPAPAAGPSSGTETPGRRGALQLLRAREFDRLTHLVESQQAAFEAEPRSERALAETIDAFWAADQTLTPLLDEWVSRQPRAWAPLLARAKHRVALAYAERGAKNADETAPEQFDAMHAALRPAIDDATAALELNRRLTQAYVALIVAARAYGDQEACGRLAGLGLAIAPASVPVRIQYAYCLLPRWGGSYRALDAFARASQTYANQAPALRALLGFVDWDRGRLLRHQRQFDEALGLFDSAIAAGESWRFYRDRGETYVRMQRYSAALDDLDRAVELSPEEPEALAVRAEALAGLGRRPDALATVQRAAELDPTNHELVWFRRHEAEAAVAQGWDFTRTQNLDAAIERYTWATDLAGGDADALYWRGRVYLQRNDATRALHDFEEAIRVNPRHIDSYRNVDWILAQRRDWDAIVQLWSRYIDLEPSSGDGYLERGGAYHHKGDQAAALADARQACQLGNPKACEVIGRSPNGG